MSISSGIDGVTKAFSDLRDGTITSGQAITRVISGLTTVVYGGINAFNILTETMNLSSVAAG